MNPTLPAEKSTPPPSPKHQRGKRGKASYQSSQDKFRLKKGAEFNAANRKRIEDKWSVDLSSLEARLPEIGVVQTAVAKEMPITTRAFGFMVNETYQKAQTRQPNSCTVYQLYRSSLLQFEVQYQKAQTLIVEKMTPPKPSATDCDLFENYNQQIISHPRNFAPISSLVNSIGKVKLFNAVYAPFLPTPSVRDHDIQTEVKIDDTNIKEKIRMNDDGSTTRMQEQIPYAIGQFVSERGFAPDPFVTTMSNLRDTVKYLANPTTSLAVRKYYYDNNPLPGALWQQYILTNPDDIMPAVYGKAQIKQDLNAVTNWLDNFKGKVDYANGEINFDGLGKVSQLVMSYGRKQLDGNILNLGDNDYYYTSESIPDGMFYLGIVSLVGEYPSSFMTSMGMLIPPAPLYSFRHHSNGAHALSADWDAIMSALLKGK